MRLFCWIKVHAVALGFNMIAALVVLIAGGSGTTFALSIVFFIIFTPLSYVCWFRPAYKGFRLVFEFFCCCCELDDTILTIGNNWILFSVFLILNWLIHVFDLYFLEVTIQLILCCTFSCFLHSVYSRS